MVVGYLGGTQLVPSTGPYPYPVQAVRDLRDADTTRHGTGKDYVSVTTKQVRQTGPAACGGLPKKTVVGYLEIPILFRLRDLTRTL